MSSRVCVQTNVGGLYFDAIFKADHTSKLTITEHPVEVGANVNDHAYVDPNELSLEIGVSDSATSVSRGGSFGGGVRSVSAYTAIRKLQEKREPITVVTRLKTYKNMMIESVSAPDDYTTTHALKATIFLREVILVQTSTVQVSTREGGDEQKAGETNGGTKQPSGSSGGGSSSTQESVLKQAAGKLGL